MHFIKIQGFRYEIDYRDGVDHWRHFEPWLEPLKDALGPVLTAYPQVPGFR